MRNTMEPITREQFTHKDVDGVIKDAGFDKLIDITFTNTNQLINGMVGVYLIKFKEHTREGIDMEKVDEADEFFSSVGFVDASDYEDRVKMFTWAYRRAVQLIVENAHHPQSITAGMHEDIIESAKYPRRVLERIVEMYCKEAEVNVEGIVANCAQTAEHMKPIEHKEGIFMVDALYDFTITNACHSQLMIKLFASAVTQYEVFIEHTAEFHAESMLQCMKVACPKISCANFINLSQDTPDEQHITSLEAFNKKATELNASIIARNYGFLVTWCISKSHFNKKKMIRQIKIDMQCEQDAIVMQKRYIMSTVRRNSQYGKVSSFIDRLAEAYQRNEAAIIKEDENAKKRIDKAYEGIEVDDKKVMDDIINSINEL